jgi:dolichyl-phosphate beta-glucosyltransferase
MQRTIIVVPCYNEAARFDPESLASAVRADQNLAFVLVDDGSTDETRQILARLAADFPSQISLVGLDTNGGKAEAVRLGLLRAFESSPELVAYLDADLATPLAELDAMRLLFDADPSLLVVLGSRVALLGREIRRSNVRHYLGRVFATFASLSLGLVVYDTQCGAKLFRNTPAIRSVFEERFGTRWVFDVEILARLKVLARAGQLPPLESCVAEYPLRCWRDVSGSKLEPAAALGAGVELARIWARYRANRT